MQPYGSYDPSINYQQNQSVVPHQSNCNNGHNMQQFSNNGMDYYYNSTPTTCQLPNNNGFLMPTNVPYVSPSINTYNVSFGNNGYIPQGIQPTFQPILSYSYNNIISSYPNVNVNNAARFNMQTSSNTTTGYQEKHFTHNMPSQVNSSNYANYSSNYGPQVSGSNNQHVSNSKKDEWFNLTSEFLNNISNNYTRNISSVPNTHQTDSKQKYPLKNQFFKTRNPQNILRILPRETKTFGTENISEKLSIDQIIANEQKKHYHAFESDLYNKQQENSIFMPLEVCNEFERVLGKRATNVNALKPVYNKAHKSNFKEYKFSKGKNCDKSNYFSSNDENSDCENEKLKELAIKCAHPDRLHPEIWYNELGELNDGPVCRCSPNSQKHGIHHNIYVGDVPFEPCLPNENNTDKLYHYRITITPFTNYVHKYPTIIKHKHNNYTFEGFSLLSHYPIPTMPTCTFTRFNTNYTIIHIEEKIPDNFVIQELNLFYDFFFKDILELVDFDIHTIRNTDGCPQFHFMPRFVRDLSNNNKELLSMSNVLKYLLNSNKLMFEENSLRALKQMSRGKWQDIVDEYKGMIITNPETKPRSIRVDQLDRYNKETTDKRDILYPVVVHFGKRPSKLGYVGNPEFKKCSKDYEKFKNLLDNKVDPSSDDKKELEKMERVLRGMMKNDKMKISVTTTFSSKGFYKTGLMCDVAQHAMFLPVLVSHFKFNKSLEYLEKSIGYKFKDKDLLKQALTHSSYRENFGTNSDHIRNTLSNCGTQQPEYGDRQNCMNKRERGMKYITISRFSERSEMESNAKNNERLEFLGDAVIEFVSSIHLFYIFPDLEEGGLVTFRTALVENRHLTFLARNLKLEDFILFKHGVDLRYSFEHAKVLATCFEAIMAAIFLDGGIEAADFVFGEILYKHSPEHLIIWMNYPKHPLQQQKPSDDRESIKTSLLFKELPNFEASTGIKFNHIRLLARAFTHRSVSFTNLTLGSNQSLQFLGDSVLKFITTDYLYKNYPEHHEGNLTLLRSSMIKNQTVSTVCNDLGMVNYAICSNQLLEYQMKDRANFVEAFIGALYVDKGLRHCQTFCNVLFLSRLPNSIVNPQCNNPKSKLQQFFQTLQYFHGGNPEIPIYKTIRITGPGHCPKYTLGVYFKGVRLAMENGQSKHKAELNAANSAFELCKDLFPQLDQQRKDILRSLHYQSVNGNINDMAIRQMFETSSSVSDSFLSKLEKRKNEIKYKLLKVFCSDKDYIEENTEDEEDKTHTEEEVDEPERKKLKVN